MSNLTISIPDALVEYLGSRSKECGYGNISDYLQALIVEDQTHRAEEQLAEMLLQSLETSALESLSEDYRHLPHPIRHRRA